MLLKQKIDSMLRRSAEAGDVPGVVAMAANAEGPIYEGAFGERVLGGSRAMTLDTVVWIASMTKAITGAGAMQLVEQGKLDLDSPASIWVPELESVQVLEGFDPSGAPRTRAPKRAISLRHLLTHTAGYGYPVWSEALARYYQVMGLPSTGSCENAALRAPLLFDPGERWSYGINLEWAGKVIEAVSGKRLSAYLQENLLGPLGMTDTAFKITPSMRERLAKVHQRGDDGGAAGDRLRGPARTGVRNGGRRALLDRARLLEVRADDPQSRKRQRGSGAQTRDSRSDVAQSPG